MPRVIILILALVASGLIYYRYLIETGTVAAPFVPTPTPTRSLRSYVEEAQARFSAGQFAEAATAYDLAIATDPQNVDLWTGKARALSFAEDGEGALKAATTAILLDEASAKAQAAKAWALWKTGRSDEAMQAASRAIALDPNYAAAHAYYALALNSLQRYDQAFIEAKKAIALDDTLIEGYFAMGYSNEAQGNWEQAISYYEQGLTLNPQVIFLYRQIALNYRALALRAAQADDKERASLYFGKTIEAFNRAVSIQPKNVVPYLDLARTYIMIDQLGTAQQYLEDALALEPENPVIHGRIALLYLQRKNYEGALASMALTVEGGVYTDTLTSGEVITYNVQPVALEQGTLEYYYTYGNLLAYFQQCDRARSYLVQALQFAPDDVTVQNSYDVSSEVCRLGGTPVPTSTMVP